MQNTIAFGERDGEVVEKERFEREITMLFENYSDEILRMCYLYLKDYHLAEDALQETFMRVTKSIYRFQGNSSQKTWLVRIAINVCKTILAEQKKKAVSYLSDDVLNQSALLENASDDIEKALEQGVVSNAIMQLEEPYREVVILHFYQELKIREIAKLLDIPMTTVAYRLRQGKQLLKSILGEE